MATCDVCMNDYDKCISVTDASGETYTFDSLECAIHALAPECAQCNMKIIGHGVESKGKTYCCESCSRRDISEGNYQHVPA